MSDFEQDIIRRVRIETQVDTDAIKKSSTTLDNFYKKYQSKEMKVDTSDFFQAVDAVRSLRKELEATKKNAPNMEGIIGQMSAELDKVGQQFERTIVRFTNGDIANGLNEAVDKITSGLSIQSVDLGNYLSTVQKNAQDTVNALKEIGAVRSFFGKNNIDLSNLGTKELEEAIGLMQRLKETQKELDDFNGQPLKGGDLYSNISTSTLSSYLTRATADLHELKQLNLDTVNELYNRRNLISDIRSGSDGMYDYWDFESVKESAKQDKSSYDLSLSNLQEYISERQRLLGQLQDNSYLFAPGEIDEYSNILTNNINETQIQIQELQQIGSKVVDLPIGGDFSEATKILGEIKESLQTISAMFKNESDSMKSMAESGVTSFESLSQAIVGVYNNLTQVQSIVDAISQKDFNITNITQTGGGSSNLQAMTQQMAVARETMEHLRQLYDQAGDTVQLLADKGQVGLVFEYQKQLQELDMTAINKSVKGANTEMKLASVSAEMQDYIDKLIQINELRNKFDLGGWKDNFVPTKKPVVKPTVRQEVQTMPATVVAPTQTVAVSNAEAQQMWQLKGAVDEVSNAIGRKNAGFIQEKEIVEMSVDVEKAKLKELVGVITNEIGVALDDIKVKFAQSLVVPELDKGNLQSSFDEIYNKFVELQEKVGKLQFNITPNMNEASSTDTQKEINTFDELIKKAAQYNDLKSFEKDNMKDLRAAGVKSHKESEDIWRQGRLLNFKPIELTKEDAISILREKIPDNILDGWFRNADSGYKSKIEQLALSDNDIRNAALNIMWSNFKEFSGKNIGFGDFLQSDIPMYRGKNSEKYVDGDELLSFTFDRKVAEKFGQYVLETLIKPINTIGSYQTTGETEGFVYKKGLEDKPEYKQWQQNMVTGKIPSVVDSAYNTEHAVDDESQSAVDAAKSFVDAANAKKQFVEANKQVAKSAEESAEAVKKESKAAEQAKQTMTAVADDTELLTDWDKEIKLQSDHKANPFAERRSKTENNGDESVRTIVESWTAIKDEDGKLTGEMELNTVQIINDFKKRTDAIAKESEKIKTAQAYLQKFLTQFDNKTMGKGSLLAGYQDLVGLANSPDFKIDDIAKAEQMMSNLDAEYNKVVQSMRKGSSSMNPFVNAINGMDKMEDVLRSLSLQFKTLNQQPDWLNSDIIGLYKQLDSLAVETDIYKFAEGFGNLKVSINSVTESIRQQRVEQKLTLSDFNDLVKATKTRDTNTEKAAKEEDGSVWKTYYLDRAAEQQKVIDTIRIGLTLTEEQESQLNAMAEKHALILGDITRENNKIEEQKQKYEEIMRLLEKNRADQIELDNDKTLDTADRSEYQQILNQERAEIEKLIANTDLNPEQKKSVNTSLGSIENDRIVKVKEYIDLLKLQQNYEQKAAKEDNGSKMQSFYNEQIAKVKNKIAAIDIQSLENQDEKNKRLALEEAHQRAIAEIQVQKERKQDQEIEKQMFAPQDKKIQEKFDAGYLNQKQYNNWQLELSEYQNYKKGVTQADEDTIKNKKQSLMQLYDTLTKVGNASKSFFTSGGEILPEEMWLNENEMKDMSGSLTNLYNNIVAERFEGMTTSVTRVQGELGKLTFTVDDGAGSLSQYTIKTNQATGATKLLADSTKPALTILQRFGQHLKKDFTGILHSIVGGSGIHTFVRYIREGIQAVRELDLALTELKKVTDATEETYDKFLDTASKTSARIGKTITEMTSATAEFAKLGYDIELASSMAESALVYANVGDNVDVETGSQSIISTMKAFGVETNNTMSIVDKFNEVGELIALR